MTDDLSRQLLEKWMVPELRKRHFVDTAEASEIAGVSRRTIQDWINSGRLTSLRIGKKHQVTVDSLIQYLGSETIMRFSHHNKT